jgi:hypothetical protein
LLPLPQSESARFGAMAAFLFFLQVDVYTLHKYVYSNFSLRAIRFCGALATESVICCTCHKARGLALRQGQLFYSCYLFINLKLCKVLMLYIKYLTSAIFSCRLQ